MTIAPSYQDVPGPWLGTCPTRCWLILPTSRNQLKPKEVKNLDQVRHFDFVSSDCATHMSVTCKMTSWLRVFVLSYSRLSVLCFLMFSLSTHPHLQRCFPLFALGIRIFLIVQEALAFSGVYSVWNFLKAFEFFSKRFQKEEGLRKADWLKVDSYQGFVSQKCQNSLSIFVLESAPTQPGALLPPPLQVFMCTQQSPAARCLISQRAG